MPREDSDARADRLSAYRLLGRALADVEMLRNVIALLPYALRVPGEPRMPPPPAPAEPSLIPERRAAPRPAPESWPVRHGIRIPPPSVHQLKRRGL